MPGVNKPQKLQQSKKPLPGENKSSKRATIINLSGAVSEEETEEIEASEADTAVIAGDSAAAIEKAAGVSAAEIEKVAEVSAAEIEKAAAASEASEAEEEAAITASRAEILGLIGEEIKNQRKLFIFKS